MSKLEGFLHWAKDLIKGPVGGGGVFLDLPLSLFLMRRRSEGFWAFEDIQVGSVNLEVDGKSWGLLQDVDLEKLFAAGDVAPFGHGEETKVDKEVRDAREFKADRVKFTRPDGRPFGWPQPYAPLGYLDGNRVYKLYKLQMYRQGGHFKPHRDTVHSENHMGTMVLFPLPDKFKGGALVVHHNGETHRCRRGACGFFTDLFHEVEPVEAGVRLVLQFDVELEDWDKESAFVDNESSEDDSEAPSDEQGDSKGTADERVDEWEGLKEALDQTWDDERLCENQVLLLLRHSYAAGYLAAGKLRGFDAHLFREMEKLGYAPELRLCIVSKNSEEGVQCQLLTADEKPESMRDVAVLQSGTIATSELFSQREMYTGNESTNAFTNYQSAGLLIKRPVSRKRKADE